MKSSFPRPAKRRGYAKAHRDNEPGVGQEPRQQARQTGGKPFAREEQDDAPFLPGIKLVLELLEFSPARVDTVFLRKGRHSKDMDRIADLCRAAGVRFSLLEPALFSRVYSGSSQGVVARLFEAGYVELEDLFASVMDAPLPLILAFDRIQDPGNAGTLARTLYALGGAGIITTRHNGAYLGAAASKAAAGALERLPVCKAGNLGQALDRAAKEGFTLYGALGEADTEGQGGKKGNAPEMLNAFHFSPRLPAILVLGGEESGMRQGMEKRCDFFVGVPMLREFDSLNVAQAGGIIISCFARAVLEKKGPGK